MTTLSYGYCRLGDGLYVNEERYRREIASLAQKLGLRLGTVFVDRSLSPPQERPALRTMLDVIEAFKPQAVLIPSVWHLAQEPAELTRLRAQFRSRHCAVLAACVPTGRAGSA